MNYYIILVLGPDFSAEEIRAVKRVFSRPSKASHGRSGGSSGSSPQPQRRTRYKEDSSDEEWDGEGKGKGKGKRRRR
jgi:hypothetical protein